MSSVRSIALLLCATAILCGACSPSHGSVRVPFDQPDSGFHFEDGGGRSGPTLDELLGRDVTAEDPPPALSGGTLLVTHDDRFAVVADPERDRVVIVDLDTRAVTGEVVLTLHDEPGRLAEDAAGRVHVALRRGGAIVSLDPAAGALITRRAVCAAPRGIAYDAAHDALHVACAGGELVTLPAAAGAATRTLHLDRDLRDVVVEGEVLYVSRFRSAEVLVLDAGGAVTTRLEPPIAADPTDPRGTTTGPSVAWRMIASPAGGVLLLHQRARLSAIVTSSPSGYGSSDACATGDSIVHAAISHLSTTGATPATPGLGCVVLGIDLALAPGGSEVLVAAAGNAPLRPDTQLQSFAASDVLLPQPSPTLGRGRPFVTAAGRVVAVAYSSTGMVIAQTREPSSLVVVVDGATRAIDLGGASREDTGQTIFHADSGGGLACASCHPEGGDDGRVWTFEGIGPRRTQSMRGGVLGTEPFHWSGDMPTFDHLMSDVFGTRMSGGPLGEARMAATARWVDTQPRLPAPPVADAAAVARGEALFVDALVDCASCHTGPHLTSNETVDVGTGGLFQVPSLRGVATRAPYLHDGCAATLRDRFGSCGGGDMHGRTSHLDEAAIGDLVAYLETL